LGTNLLLATLHAAQLLRVYAGMVLEPIAMIEL
jgi:hypothetical protein